MENKEKIKELTDKVVELGEKEKLEDLINKNEYEFDLEDKKYRVRKPTYAERNEIGKERNKKYVEMLKDDAYEMEEKLIALYKTKGIDIPKMDNELKVLIKTEEGYLEKLALTKDPSDIKTLKKDIEKLRLEQSEILVKKSDLLNYSLETQLNEHVNSYTVYLLLEEKIDDDWNKLAETYDDFLKINNENLFVQGAYLLTLLLWRKNV